MQYGDEHDLSMVMELIDKDLSEPYSIFTYRYFLQQWPHLCFVALHGASNKAVGVVVCKMDLHRDHMRGYLAMLVVDKAHRGKRIGMKAEGANAAGVGVGRALHTYTAPHPLHAPTTTPHPPHPAPLTRADYNPTFLEMNNFYKYIYINIHLN